MRKVGSSLGSGQLEIIKNSPLGNIKRPLGELIVEYAYGILLSSRMYKRTRTGFLLHRKDARLILANNIKINRQLFDVILSEMVRKGFAKKGNQGIYLKEK